MKIGLIYKSKTGFTKRYAEWIAEELKCDCLEYEKFSESIAKKYDYIIYGSRVHAGRIDGLKKFMSSVGSCKLVVFAIGATPQTEKDVINSIWTASLSETELEKIPHFYMQGGLNYEKMQFTDRMIMKVLAIMLKGKANKTSTEQGTEQAISSSYDNSSREQITPLIQYIKEL